VQDAGSGMGRQVAEAALVSRGTSMLSILTSQKFFAIVCGHTQTTTETQTIFR
jgi:ribosomal protein L16/L10AE